MLNIIKFEKNFLIITSKNLNTNEIDESIDIVDIVDIIDIVDIVDIIDEIDIVNNIIDIAAFEKLKTKVVDTIKTNDIVLQTTLTTTTIVTTNTKIIFLNQLNLCSRFDVRVINSTTFFF